MNDSGPFSVRSLVVCSAFEREAKAGGVRNPDSELAAFQLSGTRGMRERGYPAIQSRSYEDLRFHLARLVDSKIEREAEILFRILVEDDDRGLPAGQFCSVGAGVDSCGLNLRGEIDRQKSAAAEQTRKLQTVGDRLKPVSGTEGRNRRVKGMWMCGDLLRGLAFSLSMASPGKAPPTEFATEGPVPPCRLIPE